MELTGTADPAPRRRAERGGREGDDHPPSRKGRPGSPVPPFPLLILHMGSVVPPGAAYDASGPDAAPPCPAACGKAP